MDIYPNGSKPDHEIICWRVDGLFNKSGILISVPLGNDSMEKLEPIIKQFDKKQVRKFDKPEEITDNVGFVFITTQDFVDDDDDSVQTKLRVELLGIGAKLASKRLEFQSPCSLYINLNPRKGEKCQVKGKKFLSLRKG